MRLRSIPFSLVAIALSCLVAYAAYGLLWDRALPLHKTEIVVAPGSDFDAIVASLTADGVTRHPWLLRALARIRGASAKVQAGRYRFRAHSSTVDLLDRLLAGGRNSIWVTIPEGFTDRDIARRLARHGLGDERALEYAFRHDSATVDGERITGLEGFLFPDTYLVPIGAMPAQIESQMLARFRQELPAHARRRARALHVSLVGAITIASMIEREAKIDRDRPLIASVIYNRLRLGMPLQIDATVEYALPHHRSTLSYADLRVPSPYNTYLHAGLPPGPIANPGRASIEAAFHPAKTDFLYYVAKGNGSHVFARTLAEQMANIARYER
ncbi:MAG: endolytic transglycosylase MltG [Candidatus Eremiobacteraeota bacterium]|uniref:Predicted periplasmic solute-binding protein n=1 Tax=mine drainage metagenome TaxID=410659 RepID=E6PC26_9ZZZZ|nr:endolytic transglycosylase MltG [Candidatus Eremiobacteraeota bacterium]